MASIIHQMLREPNRDLIMDIKAFLMATLVRMAMRYPEPTKDNILLENTKVFKEIWDTFFTYEDNVLRQPLFKAIERIMLCEYEHDPYYRYRMDWFIEEIVESVISGKLKPRPHGRPLPCEVWHESGNYGLFESRKFKQYIER